MTPSPQATAIYARISNDAEGTRAGVERQLADCRDMAETLGWRIGG
jgi:site-specific DNA recombinase